MPHLRLFVSLLVAALSAATAQAQVLWRADTTWPRNAEGSLLAVGGEAWELKSPEFFDVVRLQSGVVTIPAHPVPEGSVVALATPLPRPLDEAFLGVTLRISSAPRGMRSMVHFSGMGYSRAIIAAGSTLERRVRLSISSQGGGGEPLADTVANLGERFRIVVRFRPHQASELWLVRPGETPDLERPLATAARPANGLRVSHVELRLHRDLAYEVSDLVVAASLADAWSP